MEIIKKIIRVLATFGFAGFIANEQSMVMPGFYFQFTLHNDSFREISLPD